jgi:hypothetical protein
MQTFKLNIQMYAAVNYATIYEQALDQVFKQESRYRDLWDVGATSTSKYKYTGGNSIQVATLTVTGMVDRDRDSIDGVFSRRHDNTWQTYTFDHEREWDTLVDPLDVDETNMVMSIGNATAVFNKEEKIPEMDKYMTSKLFSTLTTFKAANINTNAMSTPAEVLTEFDRMMDAMDEGEVSEEGRILYIIPAKNRLLRNAVNIVRQVGTSQAQTAMDRTLERLDTVKIIKITTARMKTTYDFTIGAVGTGKQVNMILVHPIAVIAPIKVDQSLMSPPSAHTKGKSLYYEQTYALASILKNKADGIQMNTVV